MTNRIRAYLSVLGPTHDNQIWRNMIQNQKASDFLVRSSRSCVILLLNQVTLFVQDRDEQMFNTFMSSPRVSTEHTMGIMERKVPMAFKY
eukprot:CCRYP_004400-RA/>CCRYP_004400-RA protein AED:0.43 eAED:0.56 QI:0/0/0/1/0/0/2/0/89